MSEFNFKENLIEFENTLRYYAETHRAYHNLDHINDCLSLLMKEEAHIQSKELKLAFIYHDIIYNPLGKNNERKSADKAIEFLKHNHAKTAIIHKVEQLIMVTLHEAIPKNSEEELMIDIDLSILGGERNRYIEYTQNIRREYKKVPQLIYRRKRKEIMKKFLQRGRIYYTDKYYKQLEDRARENIKFEIESL